MTKSPSGDDDRKVETHFPDYRSGTSEMLTSPHFWIAVCVCLLGLMVLFQTTGVYKNIRLRRLFKIEPFDDQHNFSTTQVTYSTIYNGYRSWLG